MQTALSGLEWQIRAPGENGYVAVDAFDISTPLSTVVQAAEMVVEGGVREVNVALSNEYKRRPGRITVCRVYRERDGSVTVWFAR